MCAGFYPDMLILNAYTLHISLMLQSREQADWVACFRSFPKENGIQVQGITTSGFLKTWSLGDAEEGVCLENSLGPLGVRHSKAMAFHMTRRWLLLVTTSQVLVFDVGIHLIFKHTTSEALEGGDFFNDKVLFWSRRGALYECDVKGKNVRKIIEDSGSELHVPANRLLVHGNECFYVAADIKGTLCVWNVTGGEPRRYASADASVPITGHKGLIDHLGVSAVCSVHISQLNKFIAGCNDGKLLIFSATELVLAHFFQNRNPDFTCLSGHMGAVRCILYPHTEEASYHESLLVSGGDDFSVCLWDIFKYELLHRFCVHSGPVVRLLTPPGECSQRVASAICSVSVDHSVAILSLRDRRCAFLASQHPFPIVAVRWKPYDDFLIVKCFDGSVFVWELRTGVLDRVLCGVAAEEVVYDCEEAREDVLWDFYTAGPTADELPRQPLHVARTRDTGPVIVGGLLMAPHSEAYVLLLNITKLCTHLQAIFPNSDSEDYVFRKIHTLAKPPDRVIGLEKTISNVLDVLKQEAEHLQEKFHLNILPVHKVDKSAVQRKISAVSGTQLVPYAQLTLSLLHVWGKDSVLDTACVAELGLLNPMETRSFDVASEQGSLSLRHPSNDEVQRTRWDHVAMAALVHVLDKFSFSMTSSEIDPASWQRLVHFLESLPLTCDISILEKLASLWQTKSSAVRSMARNVIVAQIRALSEEASTQLVEKWRQFLPVAPSRDNDQVDHLSAIALVLCSVLVISDKICNKDITQQTSHSLRFVVTTSGSEGSLLGAAIDLLGQGFAIWEEYFPVDEVLVAVFERCSEISDPDIILTTRRAITSIARERLSQFIAYLKYMCKTAHPILEASKPEILSSVRELLVELPRGLIALLSDAVEVLLACIDPAHLREAELSALLGVWLPQLHHNVAGQRVAVGMPDGKVVVHDLRAHRSHVFQAHEAPIAGLRFSPDGKFLIALCTSGVASLWQLSHGLFDLGVGQFRFRNVKMFPSVLPNSDLMNGINITWVDGKSITIEALKGSHAPPTVVTLSI